MLSCLRNIVQHIAKNRTLFCFCNILEHILKTSKDAEKMHKLFEEKYRFDSWSA